MPGPFETVYKGDRIRRYSRVLGAIVSDLQVITEGKTVRIPLEYLGGLRDQTAVTYQAGVAPVQTLAFRTIEVDSEKVKNRNLTNAYQGHVFNQRLPCLLGFEWCIRVKKQDEMFQIFEQVVNALYPTLDVLVKLDDGGVEENLKIIPKSYDFTDAFEGDGTEPNFYDITFMLELQGGHMYGRDLTASGEGVIIHEVDITISALPEPFKGELPWFSVYDNDNTVVRFRNQRPLGPQEGAWHYDPTPNPEFFQVIGSGTYIRQGYV